MCAGTSKVNTQEYREQATITENISLWEGLLVFNGQYTRAERTSYNNIKYFTLGGSAGPISLETRACSLCLCVLAFQDQTSKPSQSEIFSVIVACSVCSCVLAFQVPSQSEIFSVIVACSCVLANTQEQREQATITQNIVLWEGLLVPYRLKQELVLSAHVYWPSRVCWS